MPTVAELVALIEGIAPTRWKIPEDNIGHLLGDPQQPVTGVAVALDSSLELVEFAKSNGCNVVLTHHPIFWVGAKHIAGSDPESCFAREVLRAGFSHVSAHTNWDAAPGGINDVLARHLGLHDITSFGWYAQNSGTFSDGLPAEMPIGRIGTLCAELPLKTWLVQVGSQLRCKPYAYGDPDRKICRVAVVGGAADEEWRAAKQAGADIFLTGEVRHHIGCKVQGEQFAIVAAGHFPTENPGMVELANVLSARLSGVPCVHFEPQLHCGGKPIC